MVQCYRFITAISAISKQVFSNSLPQCHTPFRFLFWWLKCNKFTKVIFSERKILLTQQELAAFCLDRPVSFSTCLRWLGACISAVLCKWTCAYPSAHVYVCACLWLCSCLRNPICLIPVRLSVCLSVGLSLCHLSVLLLFSDTAHMRSFNLVWW